MSRHVLTWLAVIAMTTSLGFGLGLGFSRYFAIIVSDDPSPNRPVPPNVWSANVLSDAPFSESSHDTNSPRHTMIVDVARSVSPGVVSIGATKTTYERQYGPFGGDLFFSPYIIAPLKRNFPYLGSGIIIDQQGHVVTNYHVVEDSTRITVTLTDERTFEARLLDADRYVDVALLKIMGLGPDETLPTIPLGDSETIMIGETVLAVGNPFGPLIADPRPSVSLGVVSAVNRTFKADEHGRIYQDMIQTDAAINPGNSGGPLINLDGEAIGINTFIFSKSGSSAGVGFAIPSHRVQRIVREILKYGQLRAIRFDFEVANLTPYLRRALNLEVADGALVRAVEVGGPAERAGLKPGDVIIAVDGQTVGSASDVLANILTRTVGEELTFTIIRLGHRHQIQYRIQEGSPR